MGYVVGVHCLTPQLVLDGDPVACNCCEGCIRVKSAADRQRKFYWARKRRSHV